MTIDASLLLPEISNASLGPNDAIPTKIIIGTLYTFNAVGDVLSEHRHGIDDMHVTIVSAGSLIMSVNGVDRTIVAGDVIDLGTDPHSFVALETAQIINVTKSGVTKSSLSLLTSQINSTISHLYNRVNSLNDAMNIQVSTDTDLSNNVTLLYNKISDLKTLINS